MPLDEIHPNVRRDGASGAGTKLDPEGPAGSTATSLRSSAVQSMLKTTTELGDMGPFAVRPPRIPRSGSRLQSTRPRSGSFDTSFASALRHQRSPQRRRSGRHHGPRPVPSSSGLSSARETIHSYAASHHSGLRPKRAGHRHRSHGLQGLASPAVGPHGLYTHRSLITLRSHRDFHGLHSNSPGMHSGQGRRRGHRTSSPAFSDTRSYGRGPRPGYPRVGSAATVASSPASMFPPRPGMQGYRPELNASFTSVGRLPSPAVSAMNVAMAHGYPMQRTITPMSNSLQNFRGNWNHSATSLKGLPRSPTESTGPHYYDYSESFLEEDCFSPAEGASMSRLPFNMDQTILENQIAPERRHAQSPFGTKPGSSFHPSELPTYHNRRSSELSKHSYGGVIPPRVSSLAAMTTPLRRTSESKMSVRTADGAPDNLDRRSKDERDNPRVSTASRRTCASTHSSAFFPNASRSPRDLTTLAARVHSPICGERPQEQSIAQSIDFAAHAEHATEHRTLDDAGHIHTGWKLPAFSFRPLSFASCASAVQDRPKTSGDAQPKQATEILSPMPERPMSSQSRKRFSRIFEMDDNLPAERNRPAGLGQTFSRLNAVEESPDLHYLEGAPSTEKHDAAVHEDQYLSPNRNAENTRITIHDRSTVESLLDRHIECLGLNNGAGSPFESEPDSGPSDTADEGSADSTIKLSSLPRGMHSQTRFRPATSSSCKHSSVASSERRKLMPRRLFASMDSRLAPGVLLENVRDHTIGHLSYVASTNRQVSSGWQTLPSTSELTSLPSNTKASLTSGDLADIDSDLPVAKFKIRRQSELSGSPVQSSQESPEPEKDLSPRPNYMLHRRSHSDMLTRQTSHQRRRMRILLKAKRRSTSLGQLTNLDHAASVMADPGLDDEWTTEDSPDEKDPTSPVAGYAELSGDSVMVQPPTTFSGPSVLLSTSVPKRWTSMLAAMPEPMKKGIEMVRKASVRTVISQRSNTSVIEPLNSTRMSTTIPRLGSVPQLAPPEFGPPLTSSDLNLSLRFPEPQVFRPPLRQAQSFFSDGSTAPQPNSAAKKRFDLHLHSLRSGIARSSGLLGPRQAGSHHARGELKLSHSCQLKNQRSFDQLPSSLGETIPMSDFAFKKRKVLDRVKDWWKRHCVQKTLANIKKKNSRNILNGAPL